MPGSVSRRLRSRSSRSRATPTSSIAIKVAEHAVAAISVLGVALYVLARLPYGLYYGMLGTSPEEVGLNYAGVLAQSAVGLLVVVVLIVVATCALAALVAYVVSYLRMLQSSLKVREFNSLSDEELLVRLTERRAKLRQHFPRVVTGWPAVSETVELRRLRQLDHPTSADRAQLKRLESYKDLHLRSFVKALAGDLRDQAVVFVPRFALVVACLVAFLGLPLVAVTEAGRVKDCREPFLQKLGLLGLQGQYATITVGGETALRDAQGTLLLGDTESEIVVYECATGATVRLQKKNDLVVRTWDRRLEAASR